MAHNGTRQIFAKSALDRCLYGPILDPFYLVYNYKQLITSTQPNPGKIVNLAWINLVKNIMIQ